MNKRLKAAAAALLLAALALSVAAGSLAAGDFTVAVAPLGGAAYRNNPDGTVSAVPLSPTAGTAPAAADYTADDYKSLVKIVENQYLARKTSFTVRYNASRSSIDAVQTTLMDDVFAYDDPATTSDLDYLHWNMSRWGLSGYIYTTTSSTYAIYTFTQTFRTTADQEDYVTSKVAEILKGLNVGSVGAYAKIKAVYDYILAHVTYDKSLTRFTAYDALSSGYAVCQGYALLTYRLLAELGVPVRFISGRATYSTDGHAWNIVKIGNLWYNFDATWDDQTDSTRYFLKNDLGFTDHIRDDAYTTEAFKKSYPMSPLDYNLQHYVQTISFGKSAGVYAVGDTFALQASVTPADALSKVLIWSSSAPGVASVDSSTGKITVLSAGTAVITATAFDRSGITASFTLTAIVPDSLDAWARADVSALAARGVIPPALLSAYKSNITRAEFTGLMTNVYEYARGLYTLKKAPPFTDIAGSAYELWIGKAAELGIIGGTSPTTFSPGGLLTREQCAKIVSAAAGVINGTPVASAVTLTFGDTAAIDGWALPYVRYAFENGLMTGIGQNFEPLGILTREQAMVIAERMIEKYKW